MPSATPSHLRNQIKTGKTDHIYLIVGDDEVEKATLATEFAEAIPDDVRPFNVERLYGGEVKPSAVVSAARTVPMMADRRIVLVLRADKLFMPKRESEAAVRELELLTDYVNSPSPTTTLVFVAAAPDRRSAVVKLLLQRATVVECGGLEGVVDASRWIRARADVERMQMDADAIRLLASRAGADLARLRADVERTLLYAKGKSRVTAEDVREVVGPATLQDDWALTNAIERGSAAEALRELALVLDSGAPPVKVLGQLAWLVRDKLPSNRVENAVDAVFRTDLALKSSGGDPRVLLERLVVELCASPRTSSPARR